MMKFGRRLTAAVTAASLGGVGILGVVGTAHASVLDREQTRCGNATVTAKLERDSREHEVDVEVYSKSGGERWRIVMKDANGSVIGSMNRQTNREGEFWAWRSISGSIDEVNLDLRGPNGQRCTLQLQA